MTGNQPAVASPASYSVLQQQLIAAQERLDRQVFRLTRLNQLSDDLLDRGSRRSVASRFAEAVIDVLDVPVGAVWLLPPHDALGGPAYEVLGLRATPAQVAATGVLLRSHLERVPDAAGRPVNELVDGVLADGLLADTVACRCLDREGRTAALLLAANTRATAGMVGPITHDAMETLTLLGQKLSGYLDSAADQRVIEDQVRRLADSERKYRLLAENSSDFVLLANTERIIEWVSPSITAVLGWRPEQVMGRRTYEFVDADQRQALEPIWDRVDAGEAVTGRILALHVDGTTRWLSRTLRPVTDEAGRHIGHVAGFHDVEYEVAAERALAEARDAAEAASRAKSDFLATVTHELRTPLTTMIGAAELLLGGPLSAEQRELVQHQRDASNMLLALVNDILDLSKIEAGKVELEWLDVDLRGLLDHIVGMFAAATRDKGVRLGYAVAPGTPARVVGDPVRLAQVLVNLVSNAVKFTAQGSIEIAVSAAETRPDAVVLRFSVADTGIGIPAESQSRIFDSFAQASTSTFRVFGGSGLGLSIAQRLVALMGGTLGFDSVEGQGTTFAFTAELRPATGGLTDAVAEDEVTPGTGAYVLLAEDNKVNRVLLTRMLETAGCRVRSAVTGVEAVAAAEEERFDLVLMDLSMPDMDGFEATRRIRTLEAERGDSPATPILALTANATSNVVADAMAAGMDAFLAKPINLRDLRAAVTAWARTPATPNATGQPG